MKVAKSALKVALLIETIAFFYYLFLYKPPDCGTVCLNGLNEALVYVLPLICLTVFVYICLKIYEHRDSKHVLTVDQKFMHIIISVLTLFAIIYGVYLLFI